MKTFSKFKTLFIIILAGIIFNACSNDDLINHSDTDTSLRSTHNPLLGKWKMTSAITSDTAYFYFVFTDHTVSEYSVGAHMIEGGFDPDRVEIHFVNATYLHTNTHFTVNGFEQPYWVDGNNLILKSISGYDTYIRCEEEDNPFIGKWEMVSTIGENTGYYYLVFSNEKTSEYLIEESNPNHIQYHYQDLDYTYNNTHFTAFDWGMRYKRPYRIVNNQLIIDYPTHQEVYTKVE
ncbi:MAG: hypothetical protein E6772_03350 [Dysgonomonas sp.]|nr:hypothetical protein [Dysgonomonas sp.]